jgi:glycosyltransferase involved in cell wall biosynthesis
VRVVYLQPAERLGGAERQAVLSIKHLPAFGIEVIPVVGPGEPILRALRSAGVTDYFYCPEFPPGFEGPATPLQRFQRRAHHVTAHFLLRDRILEIARQHGAELIYASRPYGWVVGGSVAMHLGVPSVWRAGSRTTTRNQRAWLRIGNFRYKPAALVANCQAVADSIHPLLSCPSYQVPNGVDLERFDPATTLPRYRTMLGLGEAPVLGVVARPAPEKGFDALCAALPQLLQRVPSMRLLVAGDYPWRSQYESAIGRVMNGASRFVGHTDDIESFYRSCDVICLASRELSVEGSSNAVLEAMAMQRAVVATRVGGITEALTDGAEGFLAPPDDPSALAAHLGTLLSSPELRQRMGMAGRATIEARYSARAAVGRLADVLLEVGAKFSAPGTQDHPGPRAPRRPRAPLGSGRTAKEAAEDRARARTPGARHIS